MQVTQPSAYDRAITVFSPDGQLFQVEYANEAVKKGATALGVEYSSGVVLGIDKLIKPLMKEESIEKIYQVDEHIGVATSGLVADARKLIDYGRVIAQRERMVYNDSIDTLQLTKEIGDLKQKYTQYGGTRPFGASLLIAGVDENGEHLYKTDPSGSYLAYKATVIGKGGSEIREYLEKNYKKGMNKEQAIKFVLKALKKAKGKDFNEETVEIAYVDQKGKKFTKITEDEVAGYLEKC